MQNFFECVYHDKPSGYILIWSKGEKMVSTWHNQIQSAMQQAQADKEHSDVYVGCGLSSSLRKSNERCPTDQIMGIPGVWIDIDFATDDDKIHKKKNLPDTPEVALSILNTFPIAPTILINSGHGYQAWWIFENFLVFKDEDHRLAGVMLAQTFNWSLRDMARSMGYEIDATHDLARVMRVPGTINHKASPVPVESIHCSKNYIGYQNFVSALSTYRKSHLELMVTKPERPTAISTVKAIKTDEFVLDPDAIPPKLKFDTLMDMDPKFRATWNYQRKDIKDNSPSGYDLALANLAFAMDWSKQEVVNLLIACRREHNVDLKLSALKYRLTINKAYNVIEDRQAIETIEALNVEMRDADPDARDALITQSLEASSRVTGITILEISKYLVDPPEYKLVTDKGSIHLGDISNLIEQGKLRKKIADVTQHLMLPIRAERWPEVAQNLLHSLTLKYVGDEATNKGMVRAWVQSYLEHYDPLYDAETAVDLYRPYFAGQYLHIFGPSFRQFLDIHYKERVAAKTLGILLKEYGFKSHQVNFKNGDKWKNRFVWKIAISADKGMIESFVKQDMLDMAIERQREEDELKFPHLVAMNDDF